MEQALAAYKVAAKMADDLYVDYAYYGGDASIYIAYCDAVQVRHAAADAAVAAIRAARVALYEEAMADPCSKAAWFAANR